MDLLDANVLIGAFRPDDPSHLSLRKYLEGALAGESDVTFPPLVEAAFLRIVTHPKIFRTPSSMEEATAFLSVVQTNSAFRDLPWSGRMRGRWRQLCRDLGFQGNDVNDALLAAIALEGGCRLVSRDRGFERFPGLNWWNPAPDQSR